MVEVSSSTFSISLSCMSLVFAPKQQQALGLLLTDDGIHWWVDILAPPRGWLDEEGYLIRSY